MEITISVKFVGSLRNLAGKNKLSLKLEKDAPLREALKKITEKFPEIGKALIDPELNDPRPNTLIIVNGKEISVLDGLETLLRDGDDVVFVPVSHGG